MFGFVQSGTKRLKRPWWLAGTSLKNSLGQLVAPAVLFALVLSRGRPEAPIDYLGGALCVLWFSMALASVVAFKIHPEWNAATFDPGPLSPARLRLYSWLVGALAVAGIISVVLAFVLTVWSLCGVALLFFLGAFVAGSNIGRRVVSST